MIASINEQSFDREVFHATTPVLVHFWAPWCGLCRMINPLLDRFGTESGARVKVVGINADDSLKLATRYRLTTLPTLILFDGDRVVQRLEGFHGRDALRLALNEAIAPYCNAASISTSQSKTY
ncbi:MAG TPA: thioredoxin fold domain-containing protein [Oscillatoriales cyanobacterium M59_W2019_021]|nr:MAG: thioredoxin [Cyanobacteria bacterium J055]HIK34054.1 thioredoxin fold domain-containing protein [Oscillatoriales cyanobacterium M4454_W2019_049]HIK53147.1 thioredoxin fold domain-containing protein [Oscillatoriales cyanobacterium M59_W2019_021]